MDRDYIVTALGVGTVLGLSELTRRITSRPKRENQTAKVVDFVADADGGGFSLETTGSVESSGNVPRDGEVSEKNGVKVAGSIADGGHMSYYVTGTITDIRANPGIDVYIDGEQLEAQRIETDD